MPGNIAAKRYHSRLKPTQLPRYVIPTIGLAVKINLSHFVIPQVDCPFHLHLVLATRCYMMPLQALGMRRQRFEQTPKVLCKRIF